MCALLNSAELKCWGSNQEYALGMDIEKEVNIGDYPDEMGDNLVALALPAGKIVVNLWVSTHVFVLFDDHTMARWGTFVNVETSSLGHTIQIIHPGAGRIPVQVMLNKYAAIILFNTGDAVALGNNQESSLGLCTTSADDPNYYSGLQMRADGDYQIAEETPLIFSDSPSQKFKGLATSSFSHFCAITYENRVFCWGRNEFGQIGASR